MLKFGDLVKLSDWDYIKRDSLIFNNIIWEKRQIGIILDIKIRHKSYIAKILIPNGIVEIYTSYLDKI